MSELNPPVSPKPAPGDAPPATQMVAERSSGSRKSADKIPRDFGRYRLLDCVGRGGMGAVFKAYDSQLDRQVALKVPFLDDDDAETRQRFYREARTAATLQHAYICPVFDVGEFAGYPYITMAFIEGQSVAQALKAGKAFSLVQIAHLVRKLALAMQEAHNRGIIHRDLKPANVLLKPNGEPIIMDFGLARRTDDQKSDGLTKQGDIIGTVDYMSPEQVEGDLAVVGPPTDIYALGVILFELLAGRRPYEGSTTSILAQILVKDPPKLSDLRPDVPPKPEEVCRKAMAKKVPDRYATMAQFASGLAEYLRSATQSPATTVMRAAEARATPPPSANTKPIPEMSAKQSDRTATLDAEVRPSSPGPKSAPRSGSKRPRSGAKRKKQESSSLPLIIGIGGVVAVALVGILSVIIFWPKSSTAGAKATFDKAEYEKRMRDGRGGFAGPGPNNNPPPQPANPNPAPPTGAAPPKSTDPGTTPALAPPKPRDGFSIAADPGVLQLAVGQSQKVTLKLDRQGFQGPIRVSWTAPKDVRVSPAGPVTIQPNQPDPVLTLLLLAEPQALNMRLEITAAAERDSQRTSAASLEVSAVPGPCLRVIDIGDKPAGAIEAMAFTADGTLALVGGGGGKDGPGVPGNQAEDKNAVQVWNLDRGEALAPLIAHKERVTGLLVSADGKTAVSFSGDETAAVWNLATGKIKRQLKVGRVLAASISADGKRGLVAYPPVAQAQTPALVVKVNMDTLLPYENQKLINSGQLLGSKMDDAVRALAVSRDHKQGLIGGVNGKLALIDMMEKRATKSLVGHTEAVLCAEFSPTPGHAATAGGGIVQVGKLQPGRDYAVRMWDTAETKPMLEWAAEGHTASVVCLAFSTDGKLLASGSLDGEVRVWDSMDGKPVATLPGHTGKILSLAFSADGKKVWSGAVDRTMRQWKLP